MPPTPPQAISDALDNLQADADTLNGTGGLRDQAATALAGLAAAQHASDTADSAVTAAAAKLDSDRTAFVALVNSTYGSAPPAPAPEPPPPSPPAGS